MAHWFARDLVPRRGTLYALLAAVAALGRFDGLGDEMRTIVLGSLREYPLMQVMVAHEPRRVSSSA
jgi:hypothetical protein